MSTQDSTLTQKTGTRIENASGPADFIGKGQKITPFLWFDNNAEEAARFYTSVFKNSKIIDVSPMVTTFELEGQRFMGMNGGPKFRFTEAVSFYISCETQEEVDYYWNKLISGGGEESMCGWLKDKFEMSWQVIPNILIQLISDPDQEKSQRAVQAMLKMRKIEISRLKEAVGE